MLAKASPVSRRLTNVSLQYGIIAGGLADGSICLWNPAAITDGSGHNPLLTRMPKHTGAVGAKWSGPNCHNCLPCCQLLWPCLTTSLDRSVPNSCPFRRSKAWNSTASVRICWHRGQLMGSCAFGMWQTLRSPRCTQLSRCVSHAAYMHKWHVKSQNSFECCRCSTVDGCSSSSNYCTLWQDMIRKIQAKLHACVTALLLRHSIAVQGCCCSWSV